MTSFSIMNPPIFGLLWSCRLRLGTGANFTYGKRPQFELYVLEDDPFQINNVASNPEYQDVLNRLRKQLMTELEQTEDPRLIEDGRFFEEVGKFDNQNQ